MMMSGGEGANLTSSFPIPPSRSGPPTAPKWKRHRRLHPPSAPHPSVEPSTYPGSPAPSRIAEIHTPRGFDPLIALPRRPSTFVWRDPFPASRLAIPFLAQALLLDRATLAARRGEGLQRTCQHLPARRMARKQVGSRDPVDRERLDFRQALRRVGSRWPQIARIGISKGRENHSGRRVARVISRSPTLLGRVRADLAPGMSYRRRPCALPVVSA